MAPRGELGARRGNRTQFIRLWWAADDNVDYQTLPDFYDSEADEEVSHSSPQCSRLLCDEQSTAKGEVASISLRVAVAE